MNKKIVYGVIAVFVLSEIVSILMNGFLLKTAYEATASLWRPDMNSLMWIYYVMTAIGAFFFTFIFSMGYEGKGVMEGVRFGLYIGIWMGVGFAYGTYAMIAIPYSMALTWFIGTVIQYILCGIAVALIFGKQPVVTRVAPK
jgi:hypothetical protein